MTIARRFNSARVRRVGLAVPIVALLLGVTVSVSAAQGVLPWIGKSAPERGTSQLALLSAPSDPAKLSLEANGFRVNLQKSDSSPKDELIVYYQIGVADPRGFGDMLGIPRIFNPDGSIVLPREYGTTGATTGFEGGIKGLPPGSSGAIYDRAKVLAGAFIRFGPFFRSADSGVAITANGRDLITGKSIEIGGEPFKVSASKNKDGSTTIEIVNTAPNATVVASHPGSTVTVAIAGKPIEVIGGSTNFAKTTGYDVNANRSAVTIASAIADSDVVTISSSSTGAVYRGNWDFPVN